MGGAEVQLFQSLVDRYYERVAAEDLAARTVPDLFGTALAHLRRRVAEEPTGRQADAQPIAVTAHL